MPYINDNAESVYPAIYSCYLDLRRMVRTEKYKLVVYPRLKKVLLFDLEKDPHELRDLSTEQSYREVKTEMMEKLKKAQIEFNDPLGTFDFHDFQTAVN